jgi:hypothetical protein
MVSDDNSWPEISSYSYTFENENEREKVLALYILYKQQKRISSFDITRVCIL